ncbi:DNA-binding transcriptional regulator, MarR family [Nakamurella panacisegetis]|uniref:DNA-binding transcriptional regulator, MarR family n=1 Tax=Nakamurella panacisegetis TaxID=1090615 RepID=A0A1H0NGN3_9ACTN|nr:MarR family transcriptional regulator [Nakamurella panacisegetis]SDO91833.1 DNA-binding transcriptional regulator, MarR family [Nakamurella panacisegetis]
MTGDTSVGAPSWAGEPADIDRPAGADQAAEIADSIITMMRIYGSIKARIASAADPETTALFPLVRLVKEGPRRAKELAESMNADPSTVSRQVATLVRTGMVERKADPDDGRASILVPTELGVCRVQEHFVNRGQMIEPMIADWPAEDRSNFLRLLRRYTQSLEDHRDEVLTSMNRSHHLHAAASAGTPPRPQASIERSN